MRLLVFAAFAALVTTGCQQSTTSGSLPNPRQPVLDVPAGAQSVQVAASPADVRSALKASAAERGTPVIQDEPNMVVLEREMREANPALDSEFGPSDNGVRVIRVRVRFTGTPCRTLAVQDVAVINNARTALEESFVLPGNANTMQSLQGLKSRAERGSSCPAVAG